MEFRKIQIQDREWMTQKFQEDNRRGCEYSFANNFIWRDVYQVTVAEKYNCCIIRFETEIGICYAFPIGNGDKKKVLEELMAQAKEQKTILHIRSLLEEDRMWLEEQFPGQYKIQEERDSYDYIYTVEKLTKLAGKKLHGKRNHIARFKENRNWTYEPMTTENKAACLKMNREWCHRQACRWNQDMENEFCAVQEAIDHFEELGLVGGVLKADGEIVAFSVGEPLNSDTFVVHIEKAFGEIQGAYPMINQQFVTAECQEFTYVNREEDTGAEGLRKAKLSYYPDILLEKYTAEYKG